jgi:hypothetical protein
MGLGWVNRGSIWAGERAGGGSPGSAGISAGVGAGGYHDGAWCGVLDLVWA